MSNSVRPHPWGSPGKNTGIRGCHFLLQCIKMKSASEVTQSCLTLRDPMDCSLPGSSAHGIFQARVLEWGAIAFFVVKTTGILFRIVKIMCSYYYYINSLRKIQSHDCGSLIIYVEKPFEKVGLPSFTLKNKPG